MFIEVNQYTVEASQQQWLEIAHRLQVAVNDLEDAPTDNFPAEVHSTVVTFFETWAEVGAEMNKGAERLSDDLREIVVDFRNYEHRIAEELSKMGQDLE